MNNRNASPELLKEIEALVEATHYYPLQTRNVKRQHEKVIEKAISLIKTTAADTPPELQAIWNKLYEQIGTYYAFFKRDYTLAIKYLKALYEQKKSGNENDTEFAKACLLLGYAYTLDPKFQDDKLFRTALEIYKRLKNTCQSDIETEADIAFIYSQIGLIAHRKSVAFTDPAQRNALNEIAAAHLNIAVSSQRSIVGAFPNTRGQLALSLCIQATILTQQYNLVAAEETFMEATDHCIILENNKSLDLISKPHWVCCTIKIAFAELLFMQKQYDNALEMLDKAYIDHRTFLESEHHIEIADILHRMGDTLAMLNSPKAALANYEHALHIKTMTYQKTPELYHAAHLRITEKAITKMQLLIAANNTALPALLTSLTNHPHFDWNNYKTLKNYEENDNVKILISTLNQIISSITLLNEKEKFELGQCYLELGSYFNTKTDGESAINYLTMAATLLKDSHTAYINAQLALAYHQQYISLTQNELTINTDCDSPVKVEYYKEQAKKLCDIAISSIHHRDPKNQLEIETATLSYYVKACIELKSGNFLIALKACQDAKTIHLVKNYLSDQYTRVMNTALEIITAMPAAIAPHNQRLYFASSECFWKANTDFLHPNRVTFFNIYGDYLSKTPIQPGYTNLSKAKEQYKTAQQFAHAIYGKDHSISKAIFHKIRAVKKRMVTETLNLSFFHSANSTIAEKNSASQKNDMRPHRSSLSR